MNAFVNKLLDKDFVWEAIVDHLPSKITHSRTDFMNIDCPMCITRGETADRKQRCGIKRNADGLGISCFNCGYRSRYVIGDLLAIQLRKFLSAIGMDEIEVNKLNHRAFQLSRVVSDTNTDTSNRDNRFSPNFDTVSLPKNSFPISKWLEDGLDNPDFLEVLTYVLSRGDIIAQKAYWSPEERWKNRFIIPFTHKGNIVGWTGRLVEGKETGANPKYLNEVPENYLSNCDVMSIRDRKYIMMPEGVLDAEAIDGISPLGAKLSDRQTNWLKESGKTIIVIPDRDKSGQRLIDVALKNGWKVAFPKLTRGGNNWWEENCKDCAEAVKRYGRLYTLRSIIETSTDNKLEIEVRRKWLI